MDYKIKCESNVQFTAVKVVLVGSAAVLRFLLLAAVVLILESRSPFAALADLELTEIHLPVLSKCWDKPVRQLTWAPVKTQPARFSQQALVPPELSCWSAA